MLNLEFFEDGLSEKKLQLIGMSILLILLSSTGMLHPHPLKRPMSFLGHVHVSSASVCAMLCDHSGSTPAMHTMPTQL
jgi:hypothetical protein